MREVHLGETCTLARTQLVRKEDTAVFKSKNKGDCMKPSILSSTLRRKTQKPTASLFAASSEGKKTNLLHDLLKMRSCGKLCANCKVPNARKKTRLVEEPERLERARQLVRRAPKRDIMNLFSASLQHLVLA